MIIKNSQTLDKNMPITSMIGMTRAHIQTRDKITRAEDPSYFPPNYDPAHGSLQGTISTRGSVVWEMFKTGPDSAWVPQVLTNFVRTAHPGCTWQVKGVSLFAVSKMLEVVAVLHIIGDW